MVLFDAIKSIKHFQKDRGTGKWLLMWQERLKGKICIYKYIWYIWGSLSHFIQQGWKKIVFRYFFFLGGEVEVGEDTNCHSITKHCCKSLNDRSVLRSKRRLKFLILRDTLFEWKTVIAESVFHAYSTKNGWSCVTGQAIVASGICVQEPPNSKQSQICIFSQS